MKRIGMIGGMSWESTAVYYKRVNEQVRDALGGLNSADVVLRSVNFQEIVTLQKAGAWDEAAAVLGAVAVELEKAGAEMILICTNTMHLLADQIQAAVGIPLIHIADVTGRAVRDAGCRRPLLLATRYTMEQDFYRNRVEASFGLEVLVPDAADRQDVHDIIFNELCCGVAKASSQARYKQIVAKGKAAGADSVILGCTEIGLLVNAGDFDIPTFDSTLLHADAAVRLSLQTVLPKVAAVV
ncbi:aspartate/glutamate racemase family protein [Agrobacterium sp. a22-2]|uniref:aspartate/glutamate racemase family protein n=1 Tax=Agrobacterium sp. a22-2 TaxID=2283840 RepID=UPI001446012B|nr:aspartate/glutamate racemase family protein [Agrobacterium sp. a22-2]NKN37559.1 aspartate/glutamate racemase family protein [Agrobacterium sp. a22-2]